MSVYQTQKQRRSLRQSLKDLLRWNTGRTENSRTVGSGILRRADPSIAYLPRLSTVSLFPDFGTTPFDTDHRYNHSRETIDLPSPSPAHQQLLERPLLPQTSLSQFGLRNTYLQQAGPSQQVVHKSVSDNSLTSASHQASFATLTSSGLRRSASTLRLRSSTRKTSLTSAITPSQATLRSTSQKTISSSHGHERHHAATISATSSIKTTRDSPHRPSSPLDPIKLVDHFHLFCVLDTAVSGCPVTATSAELRYIFEIGEAFFLNNQQCEEEPSMDIVTGSDAAGNPVTHLVLFSPLIAPSSGRSRFMFASLIDVTEFIQETANLPQLDMISEEDSIGDEIQTPTLTSSTPWDLKSYELSVDDFLGGCSMSDEHRPKRTESTDDIWLALAATEGRIRPSPWGERHAKRTAHSNPRSTAASTSTASSVDDVLEQFVSDLQALYCDFFLLGRNALDDNCYEICNVSPKVFASKEYVDGHLSKTPREDISELSARLSQDCAFSMPINWGTRGEPKQLYCSPLYGQSSLTWICFLVDHQMPMLW